MMMKKNLLIALSLILLITLIGGCRGVVRRVEHGQYTDDTYVQSTVPDAEGWCKSIEIEISDSKITKVVYDEFNPETGSKADVGSPIGIEALRQIKQSVNIPIID